MVRRLLLILLLNFPISLLVANSKYPRFFSANYSEARTRFQQAVWALQKIGIRAEVSELPLVSTLERRLFADAVYFPATGEKNFLLILSAGVHGAEAPLGSALQLYFLRKIMPELQRQGVGVLLFHALNPYGFETGRRVTENNVDLNRNFVISPEDFQSLKNPAYDSYKSLLAPPRPVKNYAAESLKIISSMLWPALKGSRARQELRQAFAGGQYADSQGIYFGGQSYEPQVEWVDAHLAKMRAYREILHYDFHTGLGKAGSLQMISGIKTDASVSPAREVQQVLSELNDVNFVTPQSPGFYSTSGDFIDFTHARLSATAKFSSFTAEFGTLGEGTLSQISTSVRMILENRGHHWGYGTPAVRARVKKNFAELFNPANGEWRENSLRLGALTLRAALARALPKESAVPSSKNNVK